MSVNMYETTTIKDSRLRPKTLRKSDCQEINGQYPCLATNIGDNRLCIHINFNNYQKKALIFEFDKLTEDIEESFDGFVDYKNIEDIGVLLDNIKIDTTSRFVFLTRSREPINKEKSIDQ